MTKKGIFLIIFSIIIWTITVTYIFLATLKEKYERNTIKSENYIEYKI